MGDKGETIVRKSLETVTRSFRRTPPTPDDQRYPRSQRIRLLRWVGIHWWQAFILLFSTFLTTYYLPIAFAHLSQLFLQDGFHGFINISKLLHALFPDQLLPLLGRYWILHEWLIIALTFCMFLLILLALWAYPDSKRERAVLALREERALLHGELAQQGQRIVTDINHLLETQGGKTIATLSTVITQQSEKLVTDLNNLIDPRLASPFDEVTERTRYLNIMCGRYGSVKLPIGPAEGFTLHAIYQPLKLRRDPLAAEDLSYDRRRLLLGELRGSNDTLHSLLREADRLQFPVVIAENGEDALHKSPQGHMVVLGGPGTGKTVMLKYLAGNQANKALADSEAQLPVFLSLPDLARSGKSFQEYLFHIVNEMGVDARYANALWKAIQSGHALVCLDSLDEVIPSQRAGMIDLINESALSWGNAWIIGSRFTEYKSGQFKQGLFSEWEIQPMDHAIRLDLAERLFSELHRLLSGSKNMLAVESSTFVSMLENHEQASAWGENPLLFSLATIVFVHTGTLATNRTMLYQQVINAVLELRERDSTRRNMLQRVLADLALEFYQTQGRTFTRDDLLGLLPKTRERQHENWLTEEIALRIVTSGVLEVVAYETYGFRHQAFQEYLAAVGLVQRLINLDHVMRESAWNLAWSKRTYSRWTEILRLMVGVLMQHQRSDGTKLALDWLRGLVEQRVKPEGDPGNLGLSLALKSLLEIAEPKMASLTEVKDISEKIVVQWVEELLNSVKRNNIVQLERFQNLALELRHVSMLAMKAIEQLMLALDNKSPNKRQIAAETLGLLGKHRQVQCLVEKSVNDTTPEVRGAAVQALWKLGEHAQVKQLMTILARSDSRIRASIIAALGRLEADAPVELLMVALADESEDVRGEAATALGKMGEQGPVQPLINALHDKNAFVRTRAAYALGALGQHAPMEPLLAALKDDDISVRRAALEALEKLGEDVPMEPLLAAFNDNHPLVRESAAKVLGGLKERAPVRLLLEALSDKDRYVRMGAAQGLGKLGKRTPVQRLVDTLSYEVDEDVRSVIIHALGELGANQLVEQLILAIDEQIWWIRVAAAEILGKLGEYTPIETLVATLDEENWQVRAAAAEALGELGERTPIEPLAAALHDKNWQVRAAAAEALGKVGKSTSVEPLLTILEDEDEEVRAATVYALGKLAEHVPVNSLLTALEDEDEGVRVAALHALSDIARYRSIPIDPLLKALNSRQLQVRQAALITLGILREHAPIDLILVALYDENYNTRVSALHALSQIGEHAPVEQLLTLLYDESIARAIPYALSSLQGRVPQEPLLQAFEDKRTWVRAAAVEALGNLGESAPIEPLVAALRDAERDVRAAAVEALGNLGESAPIEPLVAALSDEWQPVRINATVALSKLGGERVPVESLVATLEDEDETVRSHAADALGKLGADVAVEPLVIALQDSGRFVRASAAYALGMLGRGVPKEPLIAALGDSQEFVRKAAGWALSKTHPETMPFIISELSIILQRKGTSSLLDSLTKSFIADAISNLEYNSPALRDKLGHLLDWHYWEVRMKAAQALGKLHRNISDPVLRRLLELRRGDQIKAVREAANDALTEILSLETSIEDD